MNPNIQLLSPELMKTQGRKIVLVDLDGVLVNFDKKREEMKKDNPDIGHFEFENLPGFFEDLEPMPGAVSAWLTLTNHFDCYIVSTAPWDSVDADSDKKKWIKNNLGETAKKRLILTHNKSMIKGDVLIDDRIKNGASLFPGLNILFGSEYYPNWDRVIEVLLNYKDAL